MIKPFLTRISRAVQEGRYGRQDAFRVPQPRRRRRPRYTPSTTFDTFPFPVRFAASAGHDLPAVHATSSSKISGRWPFRRTSCLGKNRLVVRPPRCSTLLEIAAPATTATGGVLSRTSVEPVVARAAQQDVVALAPEQEIVVAVAEDAVAAAPAPHDIVPGAAVDLVIVAVAVERVRAVAAAEGVVPAAAPQLILPVVLAYLVRLRRTELLIVARRSVEYGHRPSFLSVPRGRLLRISITTRCRRASSPRKAAAGAGGPGAGARRAEGSGCARSGRPRRPLSGRRRGPSRRRRAARHRRWCEQLAVELFELLDGVGDREQPA